jgi:hypothetical protein
MKTDLMTIIVNIGSSALGAGIVTFWMNFMKAEWDFRRAKIEELYAAVHKYTMDMLILSVRVRTGKDQSDGKPNVWATEAYDRINLFIDLYFPRLHLTFEKYTLAIQDFLVEDGKFRTDDRRFSEDLLNIANIGDKLKKEVVALSRQGSLPALIEAVQNYDKEHDTPR